MKSPEEMRKELNRVYCAASDQKNIPSWTKFAEFVNVPYPTIYRIITGKMPLSETMYKRIIMELQSKGVVIENSPVSVAPVNNAQNVTAPVTQTTTDDRWFDLVAEKDAQINRLLGIIEKMQS